MDKEIQMKKNIYSRAQAYYNWKSEGECRNKVAREDLKKIFYKNDSTFTFENYAIKLKVLFNLLENYVVTLY